MHTLILHSHQLTQHGEPGPEYRKRLDTGLNLLVTWKVDQILLTGWMATPWIKKRHADAAMEYTIKAWIPAGNTIFAEKMWSLETVWELVFARLEHGKGLLVQGNEISILSSDYHMPRLASIANFILWKRKLGLQFIGISGFDRPLEDEIRSLNTFYNTFAWASPWDIEKITRTLWEKHQLYKNHPLNPIHFR